MSRIFGEIRQNGYVVHDIEAALRHWTQVLGVGPFFYFERVPMTDYVYRGVPTPVDVSIALANSGPLQIELIQPRGNGPSMWGDFLRAGHEGLQHVAWWTQRIDADTARLAPLGYEIAQSGRVGGVDGGFVYYAAEAHPGSVIELSEVSGAKGRFFAHIAEAARTWDGSDAVRRMGAA